MYLIPELKKNIASVPQITNYRKYILFGPNAVQIHDNFKHVVVDVLFIRRNKNLLYVLSKSEPYF